MAPRKKLPAQPSIDADWGAALKDVTARIRKKWPSLRGRAEDIASEAVARALRYLQAHALTDTVGGLTWSIAAKIVAKDAAKDQRAKLPPRVGTRQKPTPAEQKALAPVFRDFFQGAGMLIHDMVWRDLSLRDGPGSILLSELQPYLNHLYDTHKVPAAYRLKRPARWLNGGGAGAIEFIESVNAFARDLRKLDGDGWVESEATLHARLHLPGKPRRDPYLAGDHGPELQKVFMDQYSRHAGLHFEEKRRDATNAIIRHALSEAGMSKTLLNGILGRLRAAEHREEKAERRAALRSLAAARKPPRKKRN